MTTTYTANLRLRLTADLTADARYNLGRIDTLASRFVIAENSDTRVTSLHDVEILPESDLSSGGDIRLGTASHPVDAIYAYGPLLASDPLRLLDAGSGGSKYLRLKYDSTLSGSVDGSADRTLSVDPQGADRSLILGGNLTLAAALTTAGAYPVTLTATGATGVTLPTTGTLATLAGTETLTNKTIVASANSISGIRNAEIDAAAAIARTKIASGTANHVVINDGSGVLSSESQLAKTRGGTGISSTATFPASGVVVTRDATETLSNKTISASANTISDLADASISASAAIALSKLAATTASRALVSNASGFVSASSVTATELGYVSGVTSAIQSQLAGKASTALNNLTVSGLTAGDLLYATSGSGLGRLGLGTTGQVLRVNGSNIEWYSGSGSGDVTGPASSTDNALVRFDGTTGKLVQSSGATLDDSDLLTISSLSVGALSGVVKASAGTISASAVGLGGSDVSGTLPVANGGTGQTSANSALNALLPSQATHSGKVLTTDGSDTSWTAVATTVTTTRGDLVVRGASADGRLALGAANYVLKSDGTDPGWALLTNASIDAAAAIALSKLAATTASRALVSDGSGVVSASATTATELGYVSGVTSAVQTQLDAKLAKSGGTMTGALTLAGDPATSLEAVTKQYVDSLANGLKWKAAVRVATTAAGTLASDYENGDTVDGVTLATGDRILVKNQSSASENGIYVVAASGAPARASDADAFAELNSAVVMVSEGTANADRGFIQTATLTSLSDAQTWVQNFGTGLYAADGQGIELSGSTFGLEIDGTTLSKSSSGVKVASGGITNTEVNASAAIAYSKLSLTGSIVNADVSGSAAIAGSKIVTASGATAGVVDGNAQAFNGVKTFNDGVKLDDAAGQTTLNSYIENTWTPSPSVINDISSIGAVSNARYTKIGRLVFFEFTIASVSISATSPGHLISFTLPVAAHASDLAVCGSVSWYSTAAINGKGLVELQGNMGGAGSTTTARAIFESVGVAGATSATLCVAGCYTAAS